jgi:HEAT repeat protein
LLARDRRGDPAVPELSIDQIREQMTLAIARVMAEGSLYEPDLAALSTALGEILSNDKNDHIRLAAVYALNEIGAGARPAVITIVEALKSDTYIGVRDECAHALGSIGFAGPTVLNALKEAAKSDDLGVSQAAKIALDSLPKPDNN